MRYSITSNWRIYQIYNWEKYVFHWEKLNFERIGNSVQTAEFWHKKDPKYLYYINYHLMFYPSRQHVKWKHFKFTFNNDLMMNRELNFNVTRNDFRNVRIFRWVTLFLRVSYWGQVVEMSFSSINLKSRKWKPKKLVCPFLFAHFRFGTDLIKFGFLIFFGRFRTVWNSVRVLKMNSIT